MTSPFVSGLLVSLDDLGYTIEDIYTYHKLVEPYRISVQPPLTQDEPTTIYVWDWNLLASVKIVRVQPRDIRAVVKELRAIEAHILLGGRFDKPRVHGKSFGEVQPPE